jgi:hypothetical protein
MNKINTRSITGFLATIAVGLLASTAMGASNTAGNKLQCFSGSEDAPGTYGGTCEITSGGCATLDTITVAGTDGSYAGVYVYPGLPGKPISDVTRLSFSYTVDAGAVAGGSPRLSIPIDENGDGLTDGYAFIDAANCGQEGQSSGTVDLSCPVFYGDTLYANWADFAAQNPTYRIGRDALAFVIVDQPFQGTICNVQLGKAAAKSK